MAVRIGQDTLTAAQCMTPWTDGTRICVSGVASGFSLMTFDHPSHKRWVVQYANEARRTNDGGQVRVTGPYTADILLNGAVIATHNIAVHSMGQEWSHQVGERALLRRPADLVAAGDLPVHIRPVDHSGSPTRLRLKSFAMPKPLSYGPLVPAMPSGGLHEEVHWTTSMSRWLLEPSRADLEYQNIAASAEGLSAFQFFLRHKGRQHPVDLRDRYYANSSFGNAKWVERGSGNEITMALRAAPQPYEKNQKWKIQPDTPHLACPSWELYRLNGDPYHLRAFQYCADFGIGYNVPTNRAQGSKDGKNALVPARTESRGYGKVLMLLWRAHEYTPQGDWEWLLPKSYFAQALADSEYQAAFIAKLPGTRYGRLERDYQYNKINLGIYDVNHMEMQALWTIGWMVDKGYTGFQPLLETLSGGVMKHLDTFGPQSTTFWRAWREYIIPKARSAKGAWRPTTSYDVAFDWWQNALPTNKYNRAKAMLPTGPTGPSLHHTWEEERFEGVLSSLTQMGFEQFRPYAQMFKDNRLKLSSCWSRFGRNAAPQDGCPTLVGYQGLSPDWAFSMDKPSNGRAVVPAAASSRASAAPGGVTSALPPSRSRNQAASTPATRPSTGASTAGSQRRAAQIPGLNASTATASGMRSAGGTAASNALPLLPPAWAQPSSSGLKPLPDPGQVTLPDPGQVRLPEAGKTRLPG